MQQAIQTLEVKSSNRIADHVINRMSIDAFFEKYKPVPNPALKPDEYGFWLKNCMFDICDKKHVHEISQTTPGNVWTVHHSDSGDIEWIKSGFHYANRNGFIITEEPYIGAENLIAHEDYRYLDAKIVINVRDEVDHDEFSEPLIDLLDDNKFDIGAISLEIDFDFKSIKNFIIVKVDVIEIDSNPDVTTVVKALRSIMDEYMISRPEIASFAIDVQHEVKPYF